MIGKTNGTFSLLIIIVTVCMPATCFGLGSQYNYQSISRPITAAKLFQECDPANQKAGTQISSLCSVWNEHISYLEQQLDSVCGSSGEIIKKNLYNVKGVYLKDPDSGWGHLHEYERGTAGPYVHPGSNRMYRFLERGKEGGPIERFEISNIKPGKRTAAWKESRSRIKKPLARFEVSHMMLTDRAQQAQGFFGDKTTISHRLLKTTLAERTIYYYVLKSGLRTKDGQHLRAVGRYGKLLEYLVPCKNYIPRLIDSTDKYPVSAYEFVSRVLIPQPWSDYERIALFDLTKGTGQKQKDCISSIRFGPDVTLNNLTARIERTHIAEANMTLPAVLQFGIKGMSDILTCRNYLHGPKWRTKYIFSNGDALTEKEVMSHFNLVLEKNE